MTEPITIVLELIELVTVHWDDAMTAPITVVLVPTETVNWEVGVTEAVIWLLGVVVTVH